MTIFGVTAAVSGVIQKAAAVAPDDDLTHHFLYLSFDD
jgi:hypothetical protein